MGKGMPRLIDWEKVPVGRVGGHRNRSFQTLRRFDRARIVSPVSLTGIGGYGRGAV